MDGILKMGLKSRLRWHGLDSSGSRYEQVAGACENGNDGAYKMQGIFIRHPVVFHKLNNKGKHSFYTVNKIGNAHVTQH